MDYSFLDNLRNNLRPNPCPKLEERLAGHRRLHHPKLFSSKNLNQNPFDRRPRYYVRESWRAGSAHNLCDNDADNQASSIAPSSRPSKIDSKSLHGRIKLWEKLKALESSVEIKTRLVRRCWDNCSKPIILNSCGEQELRRDVDVDSKHVLHGTATFIKIGRQDAVSQSKQQQPYSKDLESKENPKINNTETENDFKNANINLEENIRSRILDDFIGNISLNSMTHNAKSKSSPKAEHDVNNAQETENDNNMQELAEYTTAQCNKNKTKYLAEDILSPNLSKDDCVSFNKNARIDELKNNSDIWKSYTKKLENEILKWFYLVPIKPSERRSRKYQRNKLVRNLIDNVIELSNNIDDKDFKENVKFVIYLCLDSLPIWHPGYEKEISELKQQFANVLLNKILDLSKMLRHKNSKYVNTTSIKDNFNHQNYSYKVFKEDVKKQIIAEMITTLEETQRKVHFDINKYLTNSLIENLQECLHEKVNASNIQKIRRFLVERLYTIFYDIPLLLCCPKNETINLYELAEDVADSFLGIENTQNKRNTVNFFTDVKSIQTIPICKKTVESLAYLPSPKPSGNILIYQTKSGNLSIKSTKARATSLPSLMSSHENATNSEEEATSNSNVLRINEENPLETTVTSLNDTVIENRHVKNVEGSETNDTTTAKLDKEKLVRPVSSFSLNSSTQDADKEAIKSQQTTSFHSLNIIQSSGVGCKRSNASCQHVKWSEGECSVDNQTKSCPQEMAAERYLVLVVNEYLKQYEDADLLLAKEVMVTRLLLEFQKINLQTRKDVYDKLKQGEILPTPISFERFHNEVVTIKAVFKWFGRLQISESILQHPQKQIFVRNFANQIHLLRTQENIKTTCFENKLLQTVESFLEIVGAKVCKTNIKYMSNALLNRLIDEIYSEEARKNRPPCCKGENSYIGIKTTCPHLGPEEDLAKQFTDLVIDTNYNIDVCDDTTREALIRKLMREIRKITGSKLTKNDVYNTLKKIHQPMVFDQDWFKRDLIYTGNIAKWLYTLPAVPVTTVEEKKRRSELIFDLANFFNNLQQKINNGYVCNFLPDLTDYVAKWLDQVLMLGYAPSYEVFIYQLLKIMNIRKLASEGEQPARGRGSVRKHYSFEEITYDKFGHEVPSSSSVIGSPTARRRNSYVHLGQISLAKHKSHLKPSFLKSVHHKNNQHHKNIQEQSTCYGRPSSMKHSLSLKGCLEECLENGIKEKQTLNTIPDFPSFRKTFDTSDIQEQSTRKLDSVGEQCTLGQGSLRKHYSFEETTNDKFGHEVPSSSSLMGSPKARRRNSFGHPEQSSLTKYKGLLMPSIHKEVQNVSTFDPSDIQEHSIHYARPSSMKHSQSLKDYLENGMKERQALLTIPDLPSFRKTIDSTDIQEQSAHYARPSSMKHSQSLIDYLENGMKERQALLTIPDLPSFRKTIDSTDIQEQSAHYARPSSMKHSQSLIDYLENGMKERQALLNIPDLPSFRKTFDSTDIQEQSLHYARPSPVKHSQSLKDLQHGMKKRQTSHISDLPGIRKKGRRTSQRTIEELITGRKGKAKKCKCPEINKEMKKMLRDMPCVLMTPMFCFLPNL